ncbi:MULTISPECIES: penicillin-binding protein activator [unclassified Alteromonas]|uniref:penicillin-binding protein activator n=1 Tax=unclassified Alteromonas TaxID=2614992 RepID=UPI000509592B|nr:MULTISPECIES: penicillin-binding protein activator [unclassified Alteromonas]
MRHTGTTGKHITRFAVTSLLLSPLLLVGCTSTPKKAVNVSTNVKSPVEQPVTQEEITPEHKLVEAKKAWLETRNKERRDTLLLEAAELYIANQKPLLAQQVLYEVKQDGVSTANQSAYALLMAKVYVNSPDASPQTLLTLLETVPDQSQFAVEKAHLQTQLFVREGNYGAAANSLLKTDLTDEQKVEQIWAWVTSLPLSSLDDVSAQYPDLSPFVSLRKLTQEYRSTPEQLAANLRNFKRVYAGHSLGKAFPKNVDTATQLSRPSIDSIAVLLPLSGRLGATGNTIKNGIMAAYYQSIEENQSERDLPQLSFVDTTDKDVEGIVSAIGEAKFVIGPLLKDNVERVVPALPTGVNVLALNRFDNFQQAMGELDRTIELLAQQDASGNAAAGSLSEQKSAMPPLSAEQGLSEKTSVEQPIAANFFGLAPEDEAKQLAELIFNKGFRAPIVIAEQSSLYMRMDDTFKAHWETLNQAEGKRRTNITSVTFNDSNSLREGITSALDVAQSNERINQIEYMTNDEVYNMPRSRRDIDAIIAFASPQDTELLNPIIEASLNPLDGQPIPVYASSRSMDYDSGKNQWRDLKNIHFIDMPWLMPQHKWQGLAQTVDQAFAAQSTMQKRLFAFGYDAYELLPQLGILNTLQYLNHDGLTGSLSLNENGEVERQQPRAIIRNEKVEILTE